MKQRRARAFVIALAWALAVSCLPPAREGKCCDLRVLVVGSHGHGADHWVSLQSYAIENILHFNGIPYDFFDVYLDDLDQATLAQYRGVVLEGQSMHWDATEAERNLIAENMEAGNIAVLLGLIDGRFAELDSTLYAAIDVSVDGLGNDESDFQMLAGASEVYSDRPEGIIIRGGSDGRHVGMVMLPFRSWTYVSGIYGATRTYGLEVALGTWLRQAFEVDARVTLPVISLRLDDTETACAPRNQTVMDFIDANKHRIRASGYLVTNASAYQGADSTLMHDEQLISQLGSMSLHGKTHASVGAEGENQPYSLQYEETAAAVDLLQSNFPRYKPIKACPNNSWNEATLHALCDNGIYYHSADMFIPSYLALYKSLFDVASDEERERMNDRLPSQLRYYPLAHTNEMGTARVYSVDWDVVLNGTTCSTNVLPILRGHALDWWTPMLIGMHFYLPGSGGANNDPLGWTSIMNTLMYLADAHSYPWRRWVDNYDLAQNVQRFDQELAIDHISIAGDVLTYDISAAQPIRFLTLRAAKPGREVGSVTVNGVEYCYFGNDYVHLPEIEGHSLIEVRLMPAGHSHPHVTHIDPSAVVEDAKCTYGRLELTLSGEFSVRAAIVGSPRAFLGGETRFFSEGPGELRLDVSSQKQTEQVELSVVPSAGMAEVTLGYWQAADTHRRTWTEVAFPDIDANGEDSSPPRHPEGQARSDDPHTLDGVVIEHVVGDLEPRSLYIVKADSIPVDTCLADDDGKIRFYYAPFYVPQTIDVLIDSTDSGAGVATPPAAEAGDDFEVAVYPNPFASSTTVSYQLQQPSRVTVSIYSTDGALVFRAPALASPAGRHSTGWSGRDNAGNPAAPGVYLCRIDTGDARRELKMILLR